MEIKKQAKKLRDSLQQLIYKIINPLVHGMIKIGITPNLVTLLCDPDTNPRFLRLLAWFRSHYG